MKINCALCDAKLSPRAYRDKELAFCCMGCHTVYQILTSQMVHENFKDHPLYTQAIKSGLIAKKSLEENDEA